MAKTKNPVTSKVEKLLQMKTAYKEACEKQGQDLVKELVKDLFEKCPTIQAVKWTQYTPYFNDGDACTFSVHDPSFQLTPGEELTEEELEDYDDDEEGWVDSWSLSYERKKNTGKFKDLDMDAIDEFCEAHGQMEDVFEICFGDHVEVVCTRESISVEEYSHD